jgi:hypothetical protein
MAVANDNSLYSLFHHRHPFHMEIPEQSTYGQILESDG